MSLYSLHTALEHASTKQGRVSTLTAISVHQGGQYVTGSATAHLLSTSAGEHAVVFVPADAPLVNAPDRQADYTGDTGTRYYDFTSHEAALAFLGALYGIPGPVIEFEFACASEPECWLCDGCGEVETYRASDDRPITVGCPACVQRDRDAIIQRLQSKTQLLLHLVDIYQPAHSPVSPRSVPAPLARDVDLSCPASQHGMTDRASFLAHTATYQQPLTARNTQ